MAQDSDMTWQEQETLDALRRLANARSRLVQLEGQVAEGAARPAVDPADVARIEALRAEVAELGPRSRSRFGGGAARQRIADLEAEERLILERSGAADLAELRALTTAAAAPAVDPAVLDFARRELEAAEQAWIEVQALDMPEPEEDPSDDDGSDDEAPLATVTDIDLRMKPQAAS